MSTTAKLIIAAYYGRRQSYAYFNGCSDGGREGLRETSTAFLLEVRHPIGLMRATEQLYMSINLANTGIQGTSGAGLLTLAQNAATQACGEVLGGVADGLIINPLHCRWDPRTLICKPGQDPASS